ncbi:hypothetical protein QQ008_13340 [Fulvivirgaceae bacterium BMA10]|uniref:Sortilin N-terminal domain-containing protein n=1 Tax=Splendidivirga corallicola TaxID=3051826 RepID=A0ABT8KQ82_9BACT|nr:hypothetical protein [Fulvivirgaceae bacterium BMA10]
MNRNILIPALIFFGLLINESVFAQMDFEAFQYRCLGPSRGGRVTAVAGVRTEPGTFYSGATGGGVWKTQDYGTSWQNVSDGFFETPSIGDIAVAQNDPNIVYVGTGSDGLRSNVIAGKGMYKSVDGGETWEHIGLRNVGQIGAVEIHPDNHNIVYVAAIGQAFNENPERGVYKTSDGGATWEKVLFISSKVGFSDIELLPGNPEIVYATAWKAERKPWTIISGGKSEESGIYKSMDGGKKWKKLENGLPNDLVGKIDLGISAANSSVLYALVEAPEGKGRGLYRSDDQGGSFKLVSSKKELTTRPFYYTNVEVDPKDPDVVYVMATGYFKSKDGGKTWKNMNPPHGDNHDMWINPDNPQLFIQANDGGANVTHNGGKTWSTQFNQPTAEIYQVEVDDQYPYWLYGGQQDNYTTISVPSLAPYGIQASGIGWIINTGGCETGPAVPKPGDPNIVYANCKGRFSVYDKRTGTEKRYDVGAANMYGHNPKDLKFRFQRVSPIHVSPHDPNIIYHTSQYVHKTTDEGKTWEIISPDLTAFEEDKQVISGSPITRDITGEEFYSTIYAIRESSLEKGTIWVGSNDGLVHVTRDGGENWQNVTPKSLLKGGRVDAVEPSHHNPAKAYISVLRYQLGDWKPYVYKTDNYGRSWQLLTSGRNGIPYDEPTRVVREDPDKEGLLYVGTEYGLYVSLNDGQNWQSFQQNLPVTPITDIKIHRKDLVISTMGRSFWVLDDISALHREAIMNSNEVTLFKPRDTYRYRYPKVSGGNGTFPQYPRPSVIINYFLPEDSKKPVRLDILKKDGTVVNTYFSDSSDSSDSKMKPQVIEDMSTNSITYLIAEDLKSAKGMHRFHWDMRHTGPWSDQENRRYKNGPMAAPGNYTVRLSVGDIVREYDFQLIVDPRIIEGGTSLNDITAQERFGLKLVSLLSDARKFADVLSAEQGKLSKKKKESLLSDEEGKRLAYIEKLLKELITKDGTYEQPMLIDQISYLYNLSNGADQLPGKDATDRYAELNEMFQKLQTSVRFGPAPVSD